MTNTVTWDGIPQLAKRCIEHSNMRCQYLPTGVTNTAIWDTKICNTVWKELDTQYPPEACQTNGRDTSQIQYHNKFYGQTNYKWSQHKIITAISHLCLWSVAKLLRSNLIGDIVYFWHKIGCTVTQQNFDVITTYLITQCIDMEVHIWQKWLIIRWCIPSFFLVYILNFNFKFDQPSIVFFFKSIVALRKYWF